MNTIRQSRRLERARSGTLIAGICRGLANRLGWPVGLVRTLWLVITVIPILPGLPLYLILWLVLPLEELVQEHKP